MGLDTSAARNPDGDLADEDREAFRQARVVLCECDGDTSFRGKLYSVVALETTGVSLHQEWIPPEVVRRMAEGIERCDPVAAAEDDPRCTPADVVELGRFLRLCADRGLGLVGSY